MKIITPDNIDQFSQEPPKDKDGKYKKRFEVKEEATQGFVPGPYFQKNIYIDGELFDWSIDEEAYHWAEKQGPQMLMVVQQDIAKYFLECLSETVGKRVTIQDLQEAEKTGWI